MSFAALLATRAVSASTFAPNASDATAPPVLTTAAERIVDVLDRLGAAATCFACAAIQKTEAIKTERMLAAAGFQMRLADTPQKMAKLEAMTQRKLVPHEKGGRTYFAYADAVECKCVYAGTQQAHQRFQQLALQQKLANQEEMTAAMNEDAVMDWGVWGGWGPWY